jgi:hypothetical protein
MSLILPGFRLEDSPSARELLRTFGLLFPMEAEMRVCGAALKASLLAATMLATPTSAKTFIPFHSGVNLSVGCGTTWDNGISLGCDYGGNCRNYD